MSQEKDDKLAEIINSDAHIVALRKMQRAQESPIDQQSIQVFIDDRIKEIEFFYVRGASLASLGSSD